MQKTRKVEAGSDGAGSYGMCQGGREANSARWGTDGQERAAGQPKKTDPRVTAKPTRCKQEPAFSKPATSRSAQSTTALFSDY